MLKAFEEIASRGAELGIEEKQALNAYAGLFRRVIILSHPALDFEKLLINQRGSARYGHMVDQYLGRHSSPAPGLAVLSNWKDNPQIKHLHKYTLPEGSVLHPDLSFDAKKIIFGFCDHTEKNRDRRRYWIYEMAADGSWVKQLTGTPADKLETWDNRATVVIEDWDPCYLPDGGFAFITTRCQSFGRCHGSRYTPSYMLYRANADGGNIRQLSYGEANEWDPSVLNDGRIVYTRWDYINRHDTNFQSLWTTRPDGTMTRHFYGNYSVGPCMLAEARAVPGSDKAVSTAMAHHGPARGSIVMIDTRKGHDGPEPLTRLTSEIGCPERRAPQGTATWPKPVYGRDFKGGGQAETPWPLNGDGSALFEAPAGYPLQIQALDETGMAVMTLRSIVYLHPGEVQGCTGCHIQQGSITPATARSTRTLKLRQIHPMPGPQYDGGFSFVRSVQPALDRYCIGCHGLDNANVPKDVRLTGEKSGPFNQAYDSLTGGGRVKIAQRNAETGTSIPKDYFSHASKIGPMIVAGHPDKNGKARVALDPDSLARFISWLDVNEQFYGDYSFNRIEDRAVNSEGEKALRAFVKDLFGDTLASQPLEALVNRAMSTESRILKAPLAMEAGGWEQIVENGWKSTSDPNYRKMFSAIRGAAGRTI